MINLDLFKGNEVDIKGDLLDLPFSNEVADTISCTGVLEHVSEPSKALKEIYRVLKFGGRVFFETTFMQTIHPALHDFFRWSPQGLKELLRDFHIKKIEIVAGLASAMACNSRRL